MEGLNLSVLAVDSAIAALQAGERDSFGKLLESWDQAKYFLREAVNWREREEEISLQPRQMTEFDEMKKEEGEAVGPKEALHPDGFDGRDAMAEGAAVEQSGAAGERAGEGDGYQSSDLQSSRADQTVASVLVSGSETIPETEGLVPAHTEDSHIQTEQTPLLQTQGCHDNTDDVTVVPAVSDPVSTAGSEPQTTQTGSSTRDLPADAASPSGAGSKIEGMETQDSGPGDDYEKMENVVLYYHRTSGYLYFPGTQQFYMPSSYQYSSEQTSTAATEEPQVTYSSQPVPAISQSSQPTTTGGGDIASILAAVSDQATEKSGYVFDENSGMYYCTRNGLYYDQKSKLYYDAHSGVYYTYDIDTRQYEFHSRVNLPKETEKREPDTRKDHDVIDLCDSSEEEAEAQESPEEGEVWSPKKPDYPWGSPPPEDEWAPAIRVVVTSSDILPKGSVFIVTQDGAEFGREASGPNAVKLSEVSVSKCHAQVSYEKSVHRFVVRDTGSQNGTFLNEERLSESKKRSRRHPLYHGDILTLGSTTFSLHIHPGFDTCEECLPSGEGEGEGEGWGGEKSEPLDEQRRKELNRIKKKFGLRVKDTYGEQPAQLKESYQDRATKRRKTVGSEGPQLYRPDAPPSSVHRPIDATNRGRKMLEKLGWKEGEGLGRDSKGRAEPVLTSVRDERAGLGKAFTSRTLDSAASSSATHKHQRLMKRYSEVVSREKAKGTQTSSQ